MVEEEERFLKARQEKVKERCFEEKIKEPRQLHGKK